jgi:DNA invertase Pin-like site-specific DNA recombinase
MKGVFILNENDKRLWVQTLWNPINERHKSPLDSNEPGIKVAAYCRVSIKEDEQLRSLENQVHHYTHYIKNKPNWRFIGIYYDKGVSGATTSKRIGFQRLIRHAEEGKVDLILTKNISRFSRNSKELMDIVNHLKELGIGIYFEKEKIDTSTDYNKFLLSTYAALAQEEIESLSNSTMWGYEKKFLKGSPKFNRLLGYQVVGLGDKQALAIIEEEAEVVRMIFNMYLEGFTYMDIARKLSEKKIKTVKGKALWSEGIIKTILMNVTYTGNKLMREQLRDIFTNKVQYGQRDQVFIENSNEPIISTEVFNQVQKKIEANTQKRGPTKPKAYNPLAGRLKCGRCGYKFRCEYKHDSQNYRCGPMVMGICDSITYKKAMIREMMLKAMQIKYDFTNDAVVTEILKELQVINRNDHFEFHRLKYITEIEIVKKKLALSEILDTAISIERIEKEYQDFENKVEMIEDDRGLRVNAVVWLLFIQVLKAVGVNSYSVIISFLDLPLSYNLTICSLNSGV